MRAPKRWVANRATVLSVSPLCQAARVGPKRHRIQIDRHGDQTVAPDDVEHVGNGDGGHQDLRPRGEPGDLEIGIEAAAGRKKKQGLIGGGRALLANRVDLHASVVRQASGHAKEQVTPADIQSLAGNHGVSAKRPCNLDAQVICRMGKGWSGSKALYAELAGAPDESISKCGFRSSTGRVRRLWTDYSFCVWIQPQYRLSRWLPAARYSALRRAISSPA